MAIPGIIPAQGASPLGASAGAASSMGLLTPDSLGATGAAGLGTAGTTGAGGTAGISGASGSGSFLDLLGKATAGLNSDLTAADSAMASFAAGGSADISTVVLQMQEASLDLKLGVQVRDRLLEAYQEVMRLQV